MDQRIVKLAYNLVHNSCRVEKGESVLISVSGFEALDLAKAIIKELYAIGAYAHVDISETSVTRELYKGLTEDTLEVMRYYQLERMSKMDAYIGISSSLNSYEMSDVPTEKMSLATRGLSDVLRYRVDHTKWVILKYPNPSIAQAAKMSVEAFEDYFFNVSTLDYQKMLEAMQPLKALMESTDNVHIVGKNTDLSFSIKGMNAICCAGECNIPDGEVYTAPVRESINGKISYNTPNQYNGTVFEDITFIFENGKIIEVQSKEADRVNNILDVDEGARYVGEFALGVNPFITEPMLDTLFDEKICGSFHLTPGAAYEDAHNGNYSSLHWDLISIQKPAYGGGQIFFDDTLIRENGIFVHEDLLGLNPENLIG
jgi:aminopeptidase